MFEQKSAVFLVNLVQDVNILRPLVYMAARDFDFRPLILISPKFQERDLFGIWSEELKILAAETGAKIQTYASELEAFQALTGTGVIFAGSESSLPGHSATHSVLRYAPPSFLKVTLQHGFECVGFRHSPAHDRAHGHSVSFGADIICAWQPPELQPSMALSQRAKVQVTGPTAVLQQFTAPFEREPDAAGIVCENLHSVRLNATSELKNEFVDAFGEFCKLLSRARRQVVLRPHPGGQYVLKNKVALPPNASINNAPMYRLDLRQFAFGISAPSSVLIDMLLADIPTAVWRDREGAVNADNYAGVAGVSSPQEWFDFAREAAANPQPFIEAQRRFLAAQQMPLEPRDVFARFAAIFQAARRLDVPQSSRLVPRDRFLFVANAHLPTLRVCLERPLTPLVRSGDLKTALVTEPHLRERQTAAGDADGIGKWIDERFSRFAPSALIFSRYSGPHARAMVDWARHNRVPVIYQIDDDLLSVPRSLGERKFAYHNAPERLDAVRTLLESADVVYASTERLRQRLLGYDPELPVITGPINCSGRVIRRPSPGPARIIGYMASADHLPNLTMVLPAITKLLDRHPQISFELFGSIPIPQELERFGSRVTKAPAVTDYEHFLHRLAGRAWDIGICPLTPTEFNLTKSNNKWIEYTSVGIATVASANMIYDECCGDGCGILASTEEQWLTGLERLVTDDAARVAIVERAQRKLESVYSIDRHRQQIIDIVALARQRADARGTRIEEAA